ncbi:hypothetical protein ElyMa_006516600 [Elysia marginata]|uniref:ZP domain-containing protein n=1 Tax=Elysia marginata TaxID=1093978 RepID=A0AAV4I6T6_9GAST|nr:hypothetical protein ElyMa_006516600 [Elysia marginata]
MDVTFGDYPTPPHYFFLYTRQSAQNTGTVSLYEGLVAGEPVMVDLELAITIVALNFLDAAFNTALKVEFQEDKQKVVVSSTFNGVQKPENNYTDDFNFQLGNIASVHFVVTTTECIVDNDQVQPRRFQQTMIIKHVTRLTVYSTYEAAKMVSFRC